MWVYDLELKKIVFKNCSYVPGLFKIFDEIIVNAADNKQRDPTMNKIEVTIDPDENTIRVWNNGKGIPIAIHQEYNIYVPELIFGNLLTGNLLLYEFSHVYVYIHYWEVIITLY